MVTILRGTTIEIDWKVVSAFTKQPIDFEGVEARLYLIAPDNKYVIPFEVERDAFRGLKATVSTEGLTTGVYDIKVIWLRDHLCHHHDYRNVSKKCSVFAITDNPMEVNYDESFIKIVTAVESFGRDGMSAYEIATFYGVTEDEWAWSRLNIGDGLELGENRELKVKITDDFEFVDGALAISPKAGLATVEDVEERVAELVDSAPETLDTLGELAEAIEDNREVLDVLNEIAHSRDEVFVESIGSRVLKFNGFRSDDIAIGEAEVQADASSVHYHTGKKIFFASDAPIYPFAYYLGDNASHGSFTVSSALPPSYVKDVAYSIHNGFVLTDGRTLYINAPLPEGYEYGGKKKYYVCGGVYYTWGNRILVETTPVYSEKFKLSNLVDSASYAKNPLIDQRYYDMVSGDMYAWEDGVLAVYTPSEGVYVSNISDAELKMEEAVGGIAAETTVGMLNGKTYSELFDALLFPTKNPTHTDPSVSGFTLSPASAIVEVGSAVHSVSAAELNKGVWNEYNDGMAYTGRVRSTSYQCYINKTDYNDINNLPSEYTKVGDQTFKATIEYGNGSAPKNNKGVEVPELAAPAGSVSVERTVNVTMPYHVRKKGSSEMSKYLNRSTVVGSKASISMTSGVTLPSSGDLKGAYLFKVYGEIKTLIVEDLFVAAGVSLLDELTSETLSDGYTYYKYKDGLEKGEVTIKSGTIEYVI